MGIYQKVFHENFLENDLKNIFLQQQFIFMSFLENLRKKILKILSKNYLFTDFLWLLLELSMRCIFIITFKIQYDAWDP